MKAARLNGKNMEIDRGPTFIFQEIMNDDGTFSPAGKYSWLPITVTFNGEWSCAGDVLLEIIGDIPLIFKLSGARTYLDTKSGWAMVVFDSCKMCDDAKLMAKI